MPTVNVRDYGAVGDGKSDDTAAIHKAMGALPQAGGVLFFPPGHYLTDTIKARSFTTYMAHSAWAYSDARPGGAVVSPVRRDQRCLIDASGTCGTRFTGLVLRGRPDVKRRGEEAWDEATGEEMHGVRVEGGGDQCVMDDCRVDLFSGCGVKLIRCGVWVIRHSLIIFNRLCGVDAEQSVDAWLLDTMLTTNGIGMKAQGSVTITGNRVEHNERAGIVLNSQYAAGIQITGNLFCCNSGPSILHEGNIAEGVSITGNTIRHLPFTPHPGMRGDPDRDCHVRLLNMEGLAFTGNSLYCVRESEGVSTGMILGGLKDSVVMGNSLFHAATGQLIRDEGGHVNSIVRDNPGSLLVPQR